MDCAGSCAMDTEQCLRTNHANTTNQQKSRQIQQSIDFRNNLLFMNLLKLHEQCDNALKPAFCKAIIQHTVDDVGVS